MIAVASVVIGLVIEMWVGLLSPEPYKNPCGGHNFELALRGDLKSTMFCSFPVHFLRLQTLGLTAWLADQGTQYSLSPVLPTLFERLQNCHNEDLMFQTDQRLMRCRLIGCVSNGPVGNCRWAKVLWDRQT